MWILDTAVFGTRRGEPQVLTDIIVAWRKYPYEYTRTRPHYTYRWKIMPTRLASLRSGSTKCGWPCNAYIDILLLLEQGTDVEARDKDHSTPLPFEGVQILLPSCADMDMEDASERRHH